MTRPPTEASLPQSERKAVRSRFRAALRYVLTALGDVLMPRFCVVCGRRLTADERFMCGDCEDDIPMTYYWDMAFNPAADRLNENIQRRFETDTSEVGDGRERGGEESGGEKNIDVEGSDDEISQASERPAYEPYARFAALFYYNSDNGYRLICQRLKYDGDIPLGRHYSRMLGRALASSEIFRDVDAVVPVPLHRSRLRRRGYNQAAVIGKEVARELGADFLPHLLVRRRRTVTQTVLSIEEKRINVAGAFSVGRGLLRHLAGKGAKEWRPRHILIVDDVMTTGATISACHAALREVFPTSVRISAATLACVQPM